MVLQDHVTNWNHYIYIATILMATKLGKMVTYHEDLSLIHSHNILITWSHEITWQTKPIIFQLTQCLPTPNLVGRWLTVRGSQSLKPHDPLLTWPTWGHVTIWKNFISAFIILVATKLFRGLTSGRRFSKQFLKSWMTSAFDYVNFPAFCKFAFIFYLKKNSDVKLLTIFEQDYN